MEARADRTLKVGSAEVRRSARLPEHIHRSCDDDEQLVAFPVGHADATLYERSVTKKERDRWRLEDRERDRRRIPLGFRAPA
jgi:hypothetical protein